MNILLMAMPDVSPGYSPIIAMAPNLGLQSIAGNLNEIHRVKITDLVLKRKNVKKAIIESLRKTQPDVVGLSVMTFQYDTSVKIAKFIKSLNSNIKIALGGYHATLLYKEIADSKDSEYFDFIFRGESDLSFNETINKLEDGRDLETVLGLSFKRNGKFIHNKNRNIENLNQIKLPDRNVGLWGCSNVVGVPAGLIESSRGCFMSCNFCNIRNMYGKTFRTYEIQRVMRDLENAKRSGIRILLFADDNITLNINRFEHLCDEIIENGYDDLIYFTQASSLGISSSERLVEKMSKAGFKLVFLGIENASKENLKQLNKEDTVNSSVQAVKFLQNNGILISAGLIVGNPNDDYQSIKETFEFASKLKVDFAGNQILVPYPKTEIRDKLLKAGLLTNIDNYKVYNGDFANVRTKYLSDKQLSFIKYKLSKKYFKTRKIRVLNAIMKNKQSFLIFFNRKIIKLIFSSLSSVLLEKIKRLYMTEEQIFYQYLNNETKLNEFNL
ncbi:MAG: B12-binding domain-containing radical SAM protein [Candidatus Hodarchaeota archaeon]